ncbi:MAG: DJ-1/PfpI family protein [Myxococcota bacterium]|nr:DJ-1/PfpI family protein [Myxococcota bacterium]
MSHTIGILLFEDAEELDWAGPWEVFTMAVMDLPDWRVVTIAEREGPVKSAKGLRTLPDHGFADAPELDVLLVPGGQGTRREVDNPVLIDWLRKTGERCAWVTSVCTGSLLLHGAGLAEGRRITTHWGFVPELRERAAGAEVLERVRYVRDGNVVTAAGVSAGIDMSLWLVGQLWDVERARRTQRLMEYDPAPPYTAEV